MCCLRLNVFIKIYMIFLLEKWNEREFDFICYLGRIDKLGFICRFYCFV